MHKTIYWFRKGLRLHDNPALLEAIQDSSELRPIFILDPWFVKNSKCGGNRWRFLIESLKDLDSNLRSIGSRLFLLKGTPDKVFPDIFKNWKITKLAFEYDSEPYALSRDTKIKEIAKKSNVNVVTKVSHTLYDLSDIIKRNNGNPPLTLQKLQSIISEIGQPAQPVKTVNKNDLLNIFCPDHDDKTYDVPNLEDLEVDLKDLGPCLYPGGETEALRRLKEHLAKKAWICKFEKPNTEPNSLKPSTTVLSPYLKFGCLSVRLFFNEIDKIYKEGKNYTKPPVSLHGQLLWREMYYAAAFGTPNFNKMVGNKVCRQIPWESNPEHLEAWRNGRTGYPFIDAVMTQLRTEGWIHHLARHSVACFLTRGDLWISWEEGQSVFEEWLLDADWSLNAGNWMWLSASAFFHQYFRVYSPVAFGKKTDKSGEYIKKYLPILKKFPSDYIYEPWKAPKSVQERAGCIIGVDYPKPIVDHDTVRKINIERMAAAYNQNKKDVAGSSSSGGTKRKSYFSGNPAKKAKNKNASIKDMFSKK